MHGRGRLVGNGPRFWAGREPLYPVGGDEGVSVDERAASLRRSRDDDSVALAGRDGSDVRVTARGVVDLTSVVVLLDRVHAQRQGQGNAVHLDGHDRLHRNLRTLPGVITDDHGVARDDSHTILDGDPRSVGGDVGEADAFAVRGIRRGREAQGHQQGENQSRGSSERPLLLHRLFEPTFHLRCHCFSLSQRASSRTKYMAEAQPEGLRLDNSTMKVLILA
jgi:hypothetical protein